MKLKNCQKSYFLCDVKIFHILLTEKNMSVSRCQSILMNEITLLSIRFDKFT